MARDRLGSAGREVPLSGAFTRLLRDFLAAVVQGETVWQVPRA